MPLFRTETRLGPTVISAADYPTIDGAFADANLLAANGVLLIIPPGVYSTANELKPSAGVSIWGYGAVIRFTASGAGLHIDNPDTEYVGLALNGTDVCLKPLVIGTGAGGNGAKAAFHDIYVQNPGTGGTGIEIHNLQNSNFFNCRVVNSDLATVGWLIDNGSKNVNFYGCWGSTVNGPNIKITTTAGSQKTSKVNFYGGLFENGKGVLLQECEQVRFVGCGFNEFGSPTNDGFKFENAGVTPAMPSSVAVEDCQIKGFLNGFHLASGGIINSLQVGGNDISGTNIYKVEHTSDRIKETRPNFTETGVRFTSSAGADEQTVIQRAVPPLAITLSGAQQTWTDMPSAATEFLGLRNSRAWVNASQYRFARISAQVTTAGAAGSKLRLYYKTSDGTFGTFSTAGTTDIEIPIDATGTVKSAWIALATGAKADVIFTVGGVSGDGAADPVIGNITLGLV